MSQAKIKNNQDLVSSAQYLSLATYRCPKCQSGNHLSLSGSGQEVCCANCGENYPLQEGVFNFLKNPSKATANELKGMALENGFKENEVTSYQIRRHNSFPGFSEKLKSTEGEHSHYYLQTKMNYDQAMKQLGQVGNSRVLEIGSCHDYYFLKPFQTVNAECFALNIHYDLVHDPKFESWPTKVIGDMNDLPFKDGTFDFVIISATSHHSTTPEILVQEIHRVLKLGGKCLMINDPTWGIIKNLGGPDNTQAHRESHINENEYSIWRYNSMFRKAGFDYQHLFSDFYDQRLLNMAIHPRTRFASVAKLVKRFWQVSFFRQLCKRHLLWFAQAVFGFPMNVVLTKK